MMSCLPDKLPDQSERHLKQSEIVESYANQWISLNIHQGMNSEEADSNRTRNMQ